MERRLDELKELASELISAEERERRRLAEDLHDSVGQALFLARTKIAVLSPAPDAKEAGAILEDIGRMMNTMAFQLSPRFCERWDCARRSNPSRSTCGSV